MWCACALYTCLVVVELDSAGFGNVIVLCAVRQTYIQTRTHSENDECFQIGYVFHSVGFKFFFFFIFAILNNEGYFIFCSVYCYHCFTQNFAFSRLLLRL